MNLLGIFSQRHPAPDREFIETRTENLFLRAKAEAASIVAAESIGRAFALESYIDRLSRPRREPRRDKGSVAEAKRVMTAQLTAENKLSAQVNAAIARASVRQEAGKEGR